MTGREFMNTVANGQTDVLASLLTILEQVRADYCVIGGLAVNAYVEPVVSLDLDVVVTATTVGEVCRIAESRGFRVEGFEHSVNLSSPQSDLRVQLQTDPRYQAFIPRASTREVLGYEMRVAALEDVLQGKAWAYMDAGRRRSKRQKDLADILRILETRPELEETLPEEVRRAVE